MVNKAKTIAKIVAIAIIPGAIPAYIIYEVAKKLIKKTVDRIDLVCDHPEEEN